MFLSFHHQSIAKQYNKPAPPTLTRFSWVHPGVPWEEFQGEPGVMKEYRSAWPTLALPSSLLVQLLQVWSCPAGNAEPSICVPVSISCSEKSGSPSMREAN